MPTAAGARHWPRERRWGRGQQGQAPTSRPGAATTVALDELALHSPRASLSRLPLPDPDLGSNGVNGGESTGNKRVERVAGAAAETASARKALCDEARSPTYQTRPPLSDDSVTDATGSGSSGSESFVAWLPDAPRLELAGAQRTEFKATELIGEGACSKVLRATYLPTEREYAVKVVSKALAHRQGQVASLRIEQQCLQLVLGHPNIVQLAAIMEDDHFLYVVCELCPFGDLSRLIQRRRPHMVETPVPARARRASSVSSNGGGGNSGGNSGAVPPPLSIDAVRFYFAEIVSAVDALHRRGIVHRDLKPHNVLIGGGGHCKLADFGVAAIVGKTPDDEWIGRPPTRSGPAAIAAAADDSGMDAVAPAADTFVGTFAYLSPEQLRRERPAGSFESDLWALGVVLYQMLCGGELPFHGATDYLLFQSILKDDVSFPKSCLPSNSGKDLVERLLTKNPAQRLGMEALKRHAFFKRIDFRHLHRVDASRLVGIELGERREGFSLDAAAGAAVESASSLLKVTKALNAWWPRSVTHAGGRRASRAMPPLSASAAEAAASAVASAAVARANANTDIAAETLYAAHERWRQPARRVLNLASSFTGNPILTSPLDLVGRLLARIQREAAHVRAHGGRLSADYLFAAAQLQSVDPRTVDADADRVRFWVAVYNVLLVHVWLVHGSPMRNGLRDDRFFTEYFYRVFTLDYCLDDIEHGILRVPSPIFRGWERGDPRNALVLRKRDARVVEWLHRVRVSRGMAPLTM